MLFLIAHGNVEHFQIYIQGGFLKTGISRQGTQTHTRHSMGMQTINSDTTSIAANEKERYHGFRVKPNQRESAA
jgi:hypothetical protein